MSSAIERQAKGRRCLVMGLGAFGGGLGVTRALAQAGAAEVLVTDLFPADRLQAPIAATGASLHKVRLQESPNNAAEVFAETPRLEMLPPALEALVAG